MPSHTFWTVVFSIFFASASLSSPVPIPNLTLGNAPLIIDRILSRRADQWSLPTQFSSVDDFASAVGVKDSDWKWGRGNCEVQAASEIETNKTNKNEWLPDDGVGGGWKVSDPLATASNMTSPLSNLNDEYWRERDTSEAPSGSDNILRVPFAAGTYASNPDGGAGFYGSPIDMSKATQVEFTYQLFFPQDFQWVKGGKLPGLYGGRQGCSGGDPSTDCFSTRMMWREDGAGELYLYAPRNEQSDAVCQDLTAFQSCNTTDGISMGRGNFKFQEGSWGQVHQSIKLNTPGEKDGAFTVWFNGDLAIQARTGVTFRNSSDIGFIGIMGDFFFGGDSSDWAPSTDQHVYFSQASISINN